MKYFIVILGLSCLLSTFGSATTIRVPSDQPTIQAGIDAAANGDTVLVAAGTYTGEGNKDIDFLGKAIVVRADRQHYLPKAFMRSGGGEKETGEEIDDFGGAPPGNAVIDCKNEGRGFVFINNEGPDSRLEGFTIKNGYADTALCDDWKSYMVGSSPATHGRNGGGIYVNGASPTIHNCTITENTADDDGGGIYCNDSYATITNSTFSKNSANWSGGGMCWDNSSPIIYDCIIVGNSAHHDGGGMYWDQSSLTIANCIISENTAKKYGGGICCHDYDSIITNCTISRNTAIEDGGGINGYVTVINCTFSRNSGRHGGGIDGHATIINCILWNDTPDELDGYPNVSYSDIQGGWEGIGNIDADPLFVDPENGDFHLTEESPCIDVGTDAGVFEDIDGEFRPMGYGVDMGSDEVLVEGPCIYVYPGTFQIRCELWGEVEDETLTVLSTGTENLEYTVIPGNESWLSLEGELEGVLSPGDNASVILNVESENLLDGTYNDTITVLSNDPLEPSIAIPVGLVIFLQKESQPLHGILHVPEVFRTIQAAIDFAIDGDTVLVSDGTYTGSGNRDLDFKGKPIVVISENGADVTVIDCEGNFIFPHRGFYFHNGEGVRSILEGFTITDGRVGKRDGGGIKCINYSSPTISGCVITACRASTGGGIYCKHYSNPKVTNCIITGNSAILDGAGIYCQESSPVILDCTISSNNASSAGGGIKCGSSSPAITGCTISTCTASTGGGIYCESSSPEIAECTISWNTAYQSGGGISSCDNSSPVIIKCTISDNEADKYGGGLYDALSSSTISDCAILRNSVVDNGGGIYCGDSNQSLRNCIISENSATFGAGIYSSSSFHSIKNCIIAGNAANFGGGMECLSTCPIITNCVISNNSATEWGGGVRCVYSESTIHNCILWDDAPNEVSVVGDSPSISYTDIQGGWEGEGNIDEDPRFYSFPIRGFEYFLRRNSPCIDAGDPSIEDRLYDWHPRWPDWYPNGARSDMGAYGGPGNVGWIR